MVAESLNARDTSRKTRPSTQQPRVVEIEGLRGIALTLVVLFHLFGNGRVSGGVDVFLVISAFLLARSILRKAQREEGARLAQHFAGVAGRLVPPAAVVLLAVGAATLALLPPLTHEQNLREIIASALYFENWELIASQLSYGAAGPETSPLQHFWSLSVQGQFFLVWPFVTVVLVWVARRVGLSPLAVVVITTTILTVLSAAFAIQLTAVDQPVAYFNTFSRFWELGLGALLGLTLHRISLTSHTRAAVAWLGLALVISSGFLVDGGQLFPGPWTLWPVIGTMLVLLGSGSTSAHGPAPLLNTAVLRFFARISYPLYLWHWPLLIFYLQVRDYSRLGWAGALFVFVLSVLLAWLTHRLIEVPIAALRKRVATPKLLAVPVALTLLIVVSALIALAVDDAKRQVQLQAASQPSPDHIGAQALYQEPPAEFSSSVDIVPDASVAFDDLPSIYAQKCIQNYRSEPGMDEVLVCGSDVTSPSKTVIMTGGSHAQHWYPAMAAIAEQENWALIVIDKDGCRLSQTDPSDGISSCESWTERALQKIISLAPDAVFTVATETASPEAEHEFIADAQVEAWRALTDRGIPMVAVRDTPRFSFRVPECLQENDTGSTESCGIDRADTYSDVSPFLERSDIPDLVSHIDLSDSFCTDTRCEAIVGNVLVYRDDDHMTATYARTLAPALRDALVAAMPSLF